MGKPLYGAALFLNPIRYFDIVEKDPPYASRIRENFNDVLEKMVTDRTTRNLISNFNDDCKNTIGGFAREYSRRRWRFRDGRLCLISLFHSFYYIFICLEMLDFAI